jgi:hypothetical protein
MADHVIEQEYLQISVTTADIEGFQRTGDALLEQVDYVVYDGAEVPPGRYKLVDGELYRLVAGAPVLLPQTARESEASGLPAESFEIDGGIDNE